MCYINETLKYYLLKKPKEFDHRNCVIQIKHITVVKMIIIKHIPKIRWCACNKKYKKNLNFSV